MTEQSTEEDDKRRGGQRFSPETIGEFLEFSPDLACLCNGDTISLINSTGLRLLRIDDGEKVEGRKFSEFLKPEYSDDQGNFVHPLLDEHEPFPVKLIDADSSEVGVEITVRWARELGDDAIILRAHDISDLVHLSGDLMRSESRFRRLLDNAIDMICTCDKGTITFINKSGVDLLGAKNAAQIIGRGLKTIFHPDYYQIFTDSIDDLVRENTMFPVKLACLGGTYLDVQIMVSQSVEQAPSKYMVEVRDITEHRSAVMALHQSKMELEERVKEGGKNGIALAGAIEA